MKRLFNNTAFTSLDYAIVIILNLLATPILIKYFGVAEYGAFIFLTIFSIDGALSFFDLGMEGSLMNFVARFQAGNDKKRLHDSLTISVLYYAIIGLVLAILLNLASEFIVGRLLGEQALLNAAIVHRSLLIISVTILLQFLTLPFAAVLQGMRRFVITKSTNSILTVLRYLLIITAAVKFGRIDVAFIIIACLTLIKLAIFLAFFFFRLPQFEGYRVNFDPSLLRILFSYSSILFINRLVGLVCNQIDKVLIWLYLAVTNMTVYDVVSRPANLLRIVLSILNSAIVPEVARLHQQNDISSIRKIYINLIRYAYVISLPALSLLYIQIPVLLRLWVGETFVTYAWLTTILLTVYLILPIPSIASTMVVGLEMVRRTIWIPIVTTLINVFLSLLLLKYIGLAGLLTATLCAEFFGVFPYLAYMMRTLHFSLTDILRPLGGVFMVAIGGTLMHVIWRLLIPDGYTTVILVGAVLIFCLNCLINFRYLLSIKERAFIRERLRAARGVRAVIEQ